MKRIGLLGDTHGYWDDRYAYHLGQCDEIWHSGDIGDIDIIRRLEGVAPVVRAVSGNIDGAVVRRRCPEVLDFEVEGLHVWMTHIGGYPGKYSPGVKSLLRGRGVGLMISGHSHILKVIPDRELGLLHLNPGAAGVYGWQRVRTLMRFTIDRGRVADLEVIELGRTNTNDKTLSNHE